MSERSVFLLEGSIATVLGVTGVILVYTVNGAPYIVGIGLVIMAVLLFFSVGNRRLREIRRMRRHQ